MLSTSVGLINVIWVSGSAFPVGDSYWHGESKWSAYFDIAEDDKFFVTACGFHYCFAVWWAYAYASEASTG